MKIDTRRFALMCGGACSLVTASAALADGPRLPAPTRVATPSTPAATVRNPAERLRVERREDGHGRGHGEGREHEGREEEEHEHPESP